MGTVKSLVCQRGFKSRCGHFLDVILASDYILLRTSLFIYRMEILVKIIVESCYIATRTE